MSNLDNPRPRDINEIVCFECMDGNHLQCNGIFQAGRHERCDCWECLEQEINDDYLDESPDESEND